MHITAQSGQSQSEGNLAGFREQAAVGIGDDAQDVIGQPPLEQLEDGSDPARALGPDGLPGDLPELPDAHDDVIEVRSDDHGVDPAGVDVQVTDGAVADIRAAPRQAVLEVRARFQMVAPAPAPEAAGDGASLDVDGLHVHAVPAQLVRDPGHSGAPGADGNVGWKPAHGGFLRGRARDVETHQVEQLVVGQLSEADLAVAVYQFIRQLSFLREHQLDLLLHGTAGNELVDEHVAVLADAKRARSVAWFSTAWFHQMPPALSDRMKTSASQGWRVSMA